jgi:hypothetical protein
MVREDPENTPHAKHELNASVQGPPGLGTDKIGAGSIIARSLFHSIKKPP